MRFIKIQTSNTEQEILEKYNALAPSYQDLLTKLYQNLKHVEGINNDGYVYMYAIVSEEIADELCKHYKTLGIAFEYNDITKQVKYYDTCYFQSSERTYQLVNLIHDFVNEYLEVDDILDKINELSPLGLLQLTDLDKLKLSQH